MIVKYLKHNLSHRGKILVTLVQMISLLKLPICRTEGSEVGRSAHIIIST